MPIDPQATQRKESGATYVFIGWFLLLADVFFLMFVGNSIRAGNQFLQVIAVLVLIVGAGFLVVGRVKQRRGKRQLGL